MAVAGHAHDLSLEALAATPEATRRLGAALATVLQPGDTVLLGGDLGAGKTTFVQGLAAALGVSEPVTSPTFVLVHQYTTGSGWDLLHADLWRLEQLREVVDLALPEQLEEGAAAIVEWGQRAAPALAPDCLHVVIDFAPGAEGTGFTAAGGAGMASAAGARRVRFSAPSSGWRERMAALAAALSSAA
ncbi:MAG TPA: tRNA (adenosine(37)-N6)-threonylcarbamoyltransferase complex ATPase subunit type 1 TsaE [Acidimicrobiales bacterium]|nr:tRNA (adenosine(37)-N6)-threonylcarbamoyltransferase complex ATPase subunit type 1 TsaE [Acidimicrobiales bacterium]